MIRSRRDIRGETVFPEEVTLEAVIHELRRAYRSVRRSQGRMSVMIFAGNQECAFKYDGKRDEWLRV